MARRLDAFLSRQGFGSRKEVKLLLKRGRVRLDGAIERRGNRQLAGETVAVDGRAVEPLPDRLDLLLHKPTGVSCSHATDEAPLVYDLFPPAWARLGLETAGRLDRDTTGLLICTTDGGFLHRLTSPKRKLPKRYRIRWSGRLADDAPARCAAGLALPDDERPCRPAELTVDGSDDAGGRGTLVLTEGRFHQVRRMIAALGGEVTILHRDRVGGLDLPADLAPGHWRELSGAERELLEARPAES